MELIKVDLEDIINNYSLYIANSLVTVFQLRIVATTLNFFSIYFWSNRVLPAPVAYFIKIRLLSIAASSGLN